MTKREIGFALSLIATITSPVFLWFFFLELEPIVTFGLVMLIMITGLLFMRKSKTKRGRIIGGTIILIMGLIWILVFLRMEVEREERVFLLIPSIPAVMAIVGGYLGIVGAREDEVKKREYPKRFISGVSIMGFIFALLTAFVAFWGIMVMGGGQRGDDLFFISVVLVAPPLWIISVIFNAIGTVIIKRKESILQKRTKTLMTILITVTWCIIALLLVGKLCLVSLWLLWALH